MDRGDKQSCWSTCEDKNVKPGPVDTAFSAVTLARKTPSQSGASWLLCPSCLRGRGNRHSQVLKDPPTGLPIIFNSGDVLGLALNTVKGLKVGHGMMHLKKQTARKLTDTRTHEDSTEAQAEDSASAALVLYSCFDIRQLLQSLEKCLPSKSSVFSGESGFKEISVSFVNKLFSIALHSEAWPSRREYDYGKRLFTLVLLKVSQNK